MLAPGTLVLSIGACFGGAALCGAAGGAVIFGKSSSVSLAGAGGGALAIGFAGGSIFAAAGFGAGDAARALGSMVSAAFWMRSPTLPRRDGVGVGVAGLGGAAVGIDDDGVCATGAPIGVGICGARSASKVGRQLPGGGIGGGGFLVDGVGKIGSGLTNGLYTGFAIEIVEACPVVGMLLGDGASTIGV